MHFFEISVNLTTFHCTGNYSANTIAFAIFTIECSPKKASTPSSNQNVPKFFNLIFNFLIPCSLPLLADGINESSKKLNIQSLHLIPNRIKIYFCTGIWQCLLKDKQLSSHAFLYL